MANEPRSEPSDDKLTAALRSHSHPLIGRRSDYDPLLEQIGHRSIVLLGEATHGTQEFYRARIEITRRLIEEKGFTAIAIEGDWPDAHSVNRYVRGHDESASAREALHEFQRFPMWMWRNIEFLELVQWLHVHNRKETTRLQASVFGIDLYSLYSSVGEVIAYLDAHDAEAASRARQLYSCFDRHDQDPVRYGRHVRIGAQPSCEEAAVAAAMSLFDRRFGGLTRLPTERADEEFYARQNAELVRNAESYYRNIFNPLVNTWNVRDRHMADTVDNVLTHLTDHDRPPRIVIWAHNSHVGDDRATEMAEHGQWNVGQLLRQRHPGDTFHLGFTTYEGTVTAASEWDHPPKLKSVRPALPESYEALFHRTGMNCFYLSLEDEKISALLRPERLERAIGVIYAPETERESHYFRARLSEQFDGVLHFDRSNAVEPIDRVPMPEVAKPSEIQY